MEEKRNRDNVVRAVIKTARERLGLQEKQVNDLFYETLKDRNVKAPRAIMTRVRDKRRPLEFTKAEAAVLAQILRIDPSPLMPVETQASLLTDEAEKPAPSQTSTETQISRESEANEISISREVEVPKPVLENTSRDDRASKNEITIAPSGKGLELRIDYVMTHVQFERFTLAIPSYMTRQDQTPTTVRVRAKVEIFPYQAELIMRAIFGRR